MLNVNGHPQGRGTPQPDPAGDRYVNRLPARHQAELRDMAATLTRTRNPSAVDGRWRVFIHTVASQGDPVDVNALVHWLVRQSYLENNEDLRLFSDKVKGINEQKQNIRNQIGRRGGFATGLRRPGSPSGGSEPSPVHPSAYARWADALRTTAEGVVRGRND